MAQELMKPEPSLGELFSDLAADTGTLLRQEVALAQSELTQKATIASKQVGFLAVGGVVGYAGLLAVMAAVIAILSYVLPFWLSALLVGAAFGLVSYLMISSALEKLRATNFSPDTTVTSIKEDARWLKKQMT